MARFASLVVVMTVAGCQATIPEGAFVCSSEADCPSGWVCQQGYCYSDAGGGGNGPGDLRAPGDDLTPGDELLPDDDPSPGDGFLPGDDLQPGDDYEPPACDPSEVADPGGLYVSAGADPGGTGTPASPFPKIMLAIDAASPGDVIYIDQGVYPESLTFDASHQLILRGDWQLLAGDWYKSCAADARDFTQIASLDAQAVAIHGNPANVTLQTLTISTKAVGASPPGGAGESCIGILVRHATVTLRDVAVLAGHGGPGGGAGPPVTGESRGCDGVTNCEPSSGGASGLDGADGLPASSSGGFDVNGYHAVDGAPGTTGAAGQNGLEGENGESSISCLGCTPACSSTGACGGSPTALPMAAGDGTCGCGGAGGDSGGAGRGGGASVALVATGTANVTVAGSVLQAGGGGDGATGGSGTAGDAGTTGAAGETVMCYGAANGFCKQTLAICGIGYVCGFDSFGDNWLAGGAAGGMGGNGGNGGNGGGGAGGPSHALVTTDSAEVVVAPGTLLNAGSGGSGAGGAANGNAGPRYP